MSTKRPMWREGVLGLVVVAASLMLTLVFPSTAGPLPEGFFTPIIAFEFIATPEEVRALFDVADPAGFAAAMDLGNRLDFGYLLLYGGFLFACWRRLHALRPRPALAAAAVLALVAPVADALENTQLLALSAAAVGDGDMASHLLSLAVFTRLKWGALTLSFVLGAPTAWTLGRVGKGLCLIIAAATLVGVAAAFYRPLTELYSTGVALEFAALVVVCFAFREVNP